MANNERIGDFMAKKTVKAPQAADFSSAEKIAKLESQVESLLALTKAYDSNFTMLAEEVDKIRDLALGIGRRVNATIQAAEGGQITNDSVNNLIVLDNVKKLEAQVKQLLEMGVLATGEEVGEFSFVVGRELDVNGKVTNPRLQLAASTASETFKDLLIGKKLGDIILVDTENNVSFEVTELYDIKQTEVAEDAAELEQVSQEA
jgi:hypothetical protein